MQSHEHPNTSQNRPVWMLTIAVARGTKRNRETRTMEPLAVRLVIAAGLYFVLRRPFRRRPRKRPRPRRHRRASTLAGKAYVTDGDGVRVSGQEVRFAGLDAPEWDQRAKHQDGYWFGHGKRVKSALIRRSEIGGKRVRVTVEDYDKLGRPVGVVTCNGKDVGEWLVREGHAIAAYSGPIQTCPAGSATSQARNVEPCCHH